MWTCPRHPGARTLTYLLSEDYPVDSCEVCDRDDELLDQGYFDRP